MNPQNVLNTTMQLALRKAGFKQSRAKKPQWSRVKVKALRCEVGTSLPFVW